MEIPDAQLPLIGIFVVMLMGLIKEGFVVLKQKQASPSKDSDKIDKAVNTLNHLRSSHDKYDDDGLTLWSTPRGLSKSIEDMSLAVENNTRSTEKLIETMDGIKTSHNEFISEVKRIMT